MSTPTATIDLVATAPELLAGEVVRFLRHAETEGGTR
jgi:hypothetical protein